jgi:hypothetical protein
MEALLNIMIAQNNTSSLRMLFDKLESHVRQLRALGVKEEAYDSLLPSILMNKLPAEMKFVITKRVSEDDWTLSIIMAILEEECKRKSISEGQGSQRTSTICVHFNER